MCTITGYAILESGIQVTSILLYIKLDIYRPWAEEIQMCALVLWEAYNLR